MMQGRDLLYISHMRQRQSRKVAESESDKLSPRRLEERRGGGSGRRGEDGETSGGATFQSRKDPSAETPASPSVSHRARLIIKSSTAASPYFLVKTPKFDFPQQNCQITDS